VLLLFDFNRSGNVSTNFSEYPKYETTRKSVRWKLRCFLRTDGRTDIKRLVVVIRFANAPQTLLQNDDDDDDNDVMMMMMMIIIIIIMWPVTSTGRCVNIWVYRLQTSATKIYLKGP
jgi:hypothetical protein